MVNRDDHIQAFQHALNILSNYRLGFKLGMLITPSASGVLPSKVCELSRNLPILIDNGVYTLGAPLENPKLVNIIEYLRNLGFTNFKVIAPDVIEEPSETLRKHLELIKELPSNEYLRHVLFVLQGKSIDDYVKCFKNYIYKIGGKAIVKNGNIIAIGGLKPKSFRDQVLIVKEVSTRLRSRLIHGYRIKIHVLGATIQLIEETHEHVHSFDTASWMYTVTKTSGISIITSSLGLRKISIYRGDRVSWVDMYMNEIIKYCLTISLRIRKNQAIS